MPKVRTKRGFEKLPPVEVSKLTGKVIVGLDDNEALPEPPVTPTELTAQKKTVDDAIIKADKGGSLATAQRNALIAGLVVSLNKDASYVDIHCNDDLAILLSSGYEAVSTNRTQRMLNPPQIISVENGQSGELRPRVKVDPTTKSLVGRIKPVGGEFGPTVSFASTRKVIFDGLTAGLTYVFQLMAIGGSTGQSDWSDPSQGMAQ